MDEFTKEMFLNQYDLIEETLALVKADDKYSAKAVANFNLFFQDLSKITCTLMRAIQTGKIYKTPRKFNAWKKKKIQQQNEKM